MKTTRLAVLGVAIAAGGAAAWLMNSGSAPQSVVQVISDAPAPPSVNLTEVLVAAVDLPLGQSIRPGDLRWQAWPSEILTPGYVTRSSRPQALEEETGALVRGAFLSGEPVRPEKLIRADGKGFLAAVLPAGMRAMAITIDTRGANSAGGFILPNDRVDVIRTYRDETASRQSGSETMLTETLLANIRVLAIGQNVQERNGEKVVSGETATLELTPSQSETIALAQRTGQLSLALRSLADSAQKAEPQKIEEKSENSLTVVRYGVAQQNPKN
jgi:pilus assembly protein CpaB